MGSFYDLLKGAARRRNYSDELVVTAGHPAEDPDRDRATSAFSRRRRANDEVVKWNRWSS
jgi:hypothetical protein